MTTDKTLDPMRELMIGALYGELSKAQLKELEAACAAEEELRKDWQELREARALFTLAGSETQSDFASEFDEDEQPALPERRPAPVVPRWRWMTSAAAGFAAAATLFMALLLAGLRVDHTPAGLLVGFEPASESPEMMPNVGPAATLRANDPTYAYATRADLAAVAEILAQVTTQRLDQLEQRQAGTQTLMARSLYEALAERQQYQYDDLRARFELAAFRSHGYGPGQLDPPRSGQDRNQ